jgi:hypothetical protein
VTADELIELFEQQGDKCALSGLKMTHAPELDLFTNLSIDRIDPNCDYAKSNVRFVIKFLNTFRGDLSDQDFEDLIIFTAEAIKKRRAAANA